MICFSPKHNVSLPGMEESEILQVIQTWTDEYTELAKLEYVGHVQIFENKGRVLLFCRGVSLRGCARL